MYTIMFIFYSEFFFFCTPAWQIPKNRPFQYRVMVRRTAVHKNL